MKPAISIIIPVHREGSSILNLLKHIETLADSNSAEIIVIDGDGGSTIHYITPRANIKTITSKTGRAAQMNAGAKIAQSAHLLFLHADTRLPHYAIPEIIRSLEYAPAGAFALRIASKNILLTIIAAVATLRSIVTRIPFGDQAQFFTKQVFESIGGYPQVTLMEDIIIMQKLRKKRIPIRILGSSVITSARRWEKEGIMHCTARNWAIQLLFACGVSPERLIRWYPTQNRKKLL